MTMTWLFVVCWLTCAVVSWIGVTIYIKNRTAWSWKGFFEVAKANMKSPGIEMLKWILFIVIWPIEIAAVLYNAIYARCLTRRLIKNFPKLDNEES